MSLIELLLIAVSLAMDAVAVSIAASACLRVQGLRAGLRMAGSFGFFQFAMPVAGWLAGAQIAGRIAAVDHWIAFALLAFVGGRMIRAGCHAGAESCDDPTRGMTLFNLSVATSLDALAVGVSLAMVGVSIWYPSVVIGVVTGALSFAGIYLGRRLGVIFGKRMEIAGGVVLILIGARILFMHLRG